jgi:hypothetical protein
MANNYRKRCSMSLTSEIMKVKKKARNNFYTHIKGNKTKKKKN